MPPRTRKRRRRKKLRGVLLLTATFGLLVGINVYVFFFSPTNLKRVSDAAEAATRGKPLLPAELEGPPRAPRARETSGTLRAGDSLGAVLTRERIAPAEADEALRVLSATIDLSRDVRPGQRYWIHRDAAGRLTSLRLRLPSGILRADRDPVTGALSVVDHP